MASRLLAAAAVLVVCSVVVAAQSPSGPNPGVTVIRAGTLIGTSGNPLDDINALAFVMKDGRTVVLPK